MKKIITYYLFILSVQNLSSGCLNSNYTTQIIKNKIINLANKQKSDLQNLNSIEIIKKQIQKS